MAKPDPFQLRIEAVFKKRGCPTIAKRINRGYTILYQDKVVSRIRQGGDPWMCAAISVAVQLRKSRNASSAAAPA